MTEAGAYEAKTHLSKLLDRVAKGVSIAITKHGLPVAILSPAGVRRPTEQIIAEMREFRKGHTLGGQSIREMIEEGRRY